MWRRNLICGMSTKNLKHFCLGCFNVFGENEVMSFKIYAILCGLFTFPLYGIKILMVTDFFPHAIRPFVDNQITGLIDAGHDVSILEREAGEGHVTRAVRQY